MTDVAATIAMGGRRPLPTLQAHQPARFVHVTSRRIARLVQKLMVAVVEFGTGTSAQIPGVQVAGKTGTAELKNTNDPNDPNANSPQNTDSWFVGYAPVGKPRVVVGALFPAQGAGAATAAPAVHDVLEAALAGPPLGGRRRTARGPRRRVERNVVRAASIPELQARASGTKPSPAAREERRTRGPQAPRT